MRYADLKEMALAKPVTVSGMTIIGANVGVLVRPVRFRRRVQPVTVQDNIIVPRGQTWWQAVRLAVTIGRAAFVAARKSA